MQRGKRGMTQHEVCKDRNSTEHRADKHKTIKRDSRIEALLADMTHKMQKSEHE